MSIRSIRSPLQTPHGFGDSPRLLALRRRPPDAALRWVEDATGGVVTGTRALRGGSSSSIHAVRLQRRRTSETVVLRRYVIAAELDEEPDIAAREARVLELLRASAVTTPELLAVDPTGTDAGAPSVLMTRVRGRLDWSPNDLTRWLRELAGVLPILHATPITDGVQPFRPYEPESWDPPPWLEDRTLWERLLAVFHGPVGDDDRVFIHRDYHPGNVLFLRGRANAVIDWQAASIGPRAADVWHCRANLLGRFGLDVADRFLAAWESVSGFRYDPWTELVMLVDTLAWHGRRSRREQRELEALAARRLAEHG